MNNALLFPLLWLVVIFCACSEQLAGGSSQQGNGKIAGCVVLSDGSPAILTKISVRPVDYVKYPLTVANNTLLDATTDLSGHFTVSGVYPGSYAVEANDRMSSAGFVNATVEDPAEPTNVGTIGLKPYAQIAGSVDGTTINGHSLQYVQVQGLERLIPVGDDGTFVINDLPEGTFDLQLYTADSTVKAVEVFSVKTKSGTTKSLTILDGWQYSHRFSLNTTVSGADIATTVTNFPVLIRLTKNNFDFSQAEKNGADIRFKKSDNTVLPYEIELWDTVNELADIWVKVDTVRGNDNTQSFVMQWGNIHASDSSNSATVFDTANGFSGVWHLAGNSDSVFSDATGNCFNGQNSGSAAIAGIIGNSRIFSNGNYVKIPGLLKTPSSLTLSAWAQTDTSNGSGQEIVSIGDVALIRMDDNSGIGTMGSFYGDSVNYLATFSKQYLNKTGWHYIVYTFDNITNTQTLYIDGVQAAVTSNTNPLYYLGHGADTYIGNHGNGKQNFGFIGKIDEVRVNNTPVTSDWIKLCYENQKEAEALVRW